MYRTSLLFLIVFYSCSQTKSPIDQAWELYEQHQYYQALEKLASVQDKEFCERERLRGHCYWSIKLYNGASEIFENLLDSCEGDIDTYINLGDSYFKEEQDSLAHFYFKKAYEVDSTNHIVNYNLGLMNYHYSYNHAAKSYFSKAINYSPKPDADYFDILIETLCELQEFDTAFQVNKRFINEVSGQNLNHALLRKAFIYGDMRQYHKCINQIDSIISTKNLDSHNRFNAFYNRYLCWVELGDSIRACADYHLIVSEGAKNVEDYMGCEKSI